MFKKISIAVAAVALISIAAIVIFNYTVPNTAQATTTVMQANTSTASDAGISVSGSGKASGKPDVATAVLGIQVTTTSLAEATSQANTKMSAIIDKVKSFGVADKDMQTINYSVNPVTQPSNQQNTTPRITGYTVSNQLRITVRKIDDLGKILDGAVAAGANSIYGVSFSISDPKPLLAQARADAVKDAQDKAGQLAKAGGLTLGKIITINEGTSSPQPVFRAAASMALDASAVPVQTGEMEISVSIEVRFAVQ
jgi:uncharacterized protein YggE